MPFQGRCLTMLPMQLAKTSAVLGAVATPFSKDSHFWFPHPVQPEVSVRALIKVFACLSPGG